MDFNRSKIELTCCGKVVYSEVFQEGWNFQNGTMRLPGNSTCSVCHKIYGGTLTVRIKTFTPPFLIIPMPLNVEGRGPECDVTKIVKNTLEIWDATGQTVTSGLLTEQEAVIALTDARRKFQEAPTP